MLIYKSVTIYLLPCIGVYVGRASWGFIGTFCCFLCKCCGCYYYKDTGFDGVGAIGDAEEARDVEFIRANELSVVEEGQRMHLFEGKIEPADLCQGAVGDCWLVAAMASLAEHPGAIRNCFLNWEYSDRGKYRVRLWDGRAGKWCIVTVDDRIPVRKGTKEAKYMKPNGNELWAAILEKAFAKFCGGYNQLDGGLSLWAWHAMTGDYVFQLMQKGTKWERRDMYFVGDDDGPKGRRRIGFANEGDADVLEEDRFFRVLLKYSYKHSLMGAANITGEREGHGDNGIVSGHAYSILQVRRAGTTLGMGGIKLLQLRNPWGTFEWNGAWSDGSDEWKKHPGVASEVGYNETDDGTFWMEYKDFARTFNMVDICDRTTKDDLRLDVNEDEGCLGPMKGCVGGCGQFWCCCMGARVIYCGNQTSSETEKGAGCCVTG